jgi:hypothetical protein
MLHTSLTLLDCVDDDVVEASNGGRDSDIKLVVNDSKISKTALAVTSGLVPGRTGLAESLTW